MDRSQVWLFAEGVYLKEENEVDGFVGLKLLPCAIYRGRSILAWELDLRKNQGSNSLAD